MNFKTIIMGFIGLVAVSLIGLGIYGFMMSKDNNTTENNTSENTDSNQNENKNTTLQQLANAINDSTALEAFYADEITLEISATATDNLLIINVNNDEYNYILEGDILSITNGEDDLYAGPAFLAVVNSVAILHGYADGDIVYYLKENADNLESYTLEDGFSAKQNGNTLNIKVDISKKMELTEDTVPVDTGIIEQAREDAAKNSAYGYASAVENYLALSLLDPNSEVPLDGEFARTDIEVSGNSPTAVSLTLSRGTIVGGTITIEGYTSTFDETGKIVLVTKE